MALLNDFNVSQKYIYKIVIYIILGIIKAPIK